MSKITEVRSEDIKVGDVIISVRTHPTDEGVVTLSERGKVYKVNDTYMGRHMSHFADLDVSFLRGGNVSLSENMGPKRNDSYGQYTHYDKLFKVTE